MCTELYQRSWYNLKMLPKKQEKNWQMETLMKLPKYQY